MSVMVTVLGCQEHLRNQFSHKSEVRFYQILLKILQLIHQFMHQKTTEKHIIVVS